MPSVNRYISNVAKSVKYAAVGVLKDYNPVVVDTISSGRDAIHERIESFREMASDSTSSSAQNQFGVGDILNLVNTAKSNMITDLKNGTLYNKERQDKASDSILDSFGGGGGDDYGFGDLDFDISDDDDDFDVDTSSSSKKSVTDVLDDVGEKATNAVGKVLINTTEYQVSVQKQTSTQIIANQTAVAARLHTDLASINTNIGTIMKFNTEVMGTHIENSKLFYETQKDQMNEQTAILKEMLDIQKSIYRPEKKYNRRLTAEDIFTSNGGIDFSALRDLRKQGGGGMLGGMGGMAGMGLEMMGPEIAANPIGFLLKEGMKALTPKLLKNAFKEFNETLSGAIATTIFKASDLKYSDNIIKSFIGDAFGVDLSTKNSISTSNYEKGAVPWSGKDHKALTEVIPTLLTKIHSAITNEQERYYDYDRGRFTTIDEIRKDLKNQRNMYVNHANQAIIPEMNKQMKQVNFVNDKNKDDFRKDLELFFKYNFNQTRAFNPDRMSLDPKTYGMTGENSAYNLKVIKEIYKKIPKTAKLMYHKDLISAKNSNNRYMKQIEEQGDSPINVIFNGSATGANGKKVSPLAALSANSEAAAAKLDTTNDILERIYGAITNSNAIGRSASPVVEETATSETTESATPSKPKKLSRREKKKQKRQQDKIARANRATMKKAKSATSTSPENTVVGSSLDIDENNNRFVYGSEEIYIPDEPEEEKQKYLDKIKSAETASGKLKAFFSGFALLTQKPVEFMANTLKKVDEHLYDLLIGDSTKDGETKSIMGKLTSKINEYFTTLKDNTVEAIKGIKESYGKPLKDKVKGFINDFFGVDIDQTMGDFKEAMFGDKNTTMAAGMRKVVGTGFKEIFGDIKRDIFGDPNDPEGFGNQLKNVIHGNLNEQGKEKQANYSEAADKLGALLDDIGQSGESPSEDKPKKKKNKKTNKKVEDAIAKRVKKLIDADQNTEKYTSKSKKKKKKKDSFEGSSDIFGPGVDGVGETEYESEEESKNNSDNFDDVFGGDIPKSAKGMRRVSKTGIVAVSEGEMIIPPDMNPYNISERNRKEDTAISKFRSSIRSTENISKFSAGGLIVKGVKGVAKAVGNKAKKKFEYSPDMTYKQFNAFYETLETDEEKALYRKKFAKDYAKRAKEAFLNAKDDTIDVLRSTAGDIKANNPALFDAIQDETKKMSNRMKKVGVFHSKDDYEEGQENIIYKMGDEAKSAANTLFDAFFGEDAMSKMSEKFAPSDKAKDAVADVLTNFKSYLPRVAAGGVGGAALSIMLGLAGGPLLGAAIGAGSALITRSSSIQDWLFGEKVEDENGNSTREGGVISKDIANNIEKYFPGMAKGAIAGGITSILPFVPGGPVAGIMVGSAIGYARSNEELREKLFGSDKALGKLKDRVVKMAPRMGVGAVAGALTGPFGLVTNMAVGAGLGMISDTDQFQTVVFGNIGSDGKRHGGIVGFIKESAEVPLNGIRKILDDARDFLEKDIIDPLKRGFAPFARQLRNIGQWITDKIGDGLKIWVAKPIGHAIAKHLVQPLERGVGHLLKPFISAGKFAVSWLPKMFGALGDTITKRQLSVIDGYGGSARTRNAQRVQFGEQYAKLVRGAKLNDGSDPREKYMNTASAKLDTFMLNASDEDLNKVYVAQQLGRKKSELVKANGKFRTIDKIVVNALKDTDLAETLTSDENAHKITPRDRIMIIDLVKKNKYKEAAEYIDAIPGYTKEEREKCKQVAKNACKKIATARADAEEALAELNKDGDYLEKLTGLKGKQIYSAATVRQVKNEIDLRSKQKDEEFKAQLSENGEVGLTESTEFENQISSFADYTKEYYDKQLEKLDVIIEAARVIAFPNADDSKDAINANEGGAGVSSDTIKGNPINPNEDSTVSVTGSEEFENQISSFADYTKEYYDGQLSKLDELIEATRAIAFPNADDSQDAINDSKNGAGVNPETIKGESKKQQEEKEQQAKKEAKAKVEAEEAKKKEDEKESSKKETKQEVTEDGIVSMEKDNNGYWTYAKDAMTRATLKAKAAKNKVQQTIADKVSDIGGFLGGIFGKNDEDDDEDSGGFLSSILGFIPSLLNSRVGSVIKGMLAGAAFLGIAGTNINTYEKDENGNTVYDENGEPVVAETNTLGSVVTTKLHDLLFGEDGESGLVGKLKDLFNEHMLPSIVLGCNWFKNEVLPGVIHFGLSAAGKIVSGLTAWLADNLQDIIYAACKGIGYIIGEAIDGIMNGGKETSELSGVEYKVAGVDDDSEDEDPYTYMRNNVKDLDLSSTSDSYGSTTTTSSTISKAANSTSTKANNATKAATSNSSDTTKGGSTSNNTTSNTGTTSTIRQQIENSAAYQNLSDDAKESYATQLEANWDNESAIKGYTVGDIVSGALPDGIVATVNGQDVNVANEDVLTNRTIASQVLGIDTSASKDYTTRHMNNSVAASLPNAVADAAIFKGMTGNGALVRVVPKVGKITKTAISKTADAITGGTSGLTTLTSRATDALATANAKSYLEAAGMDTGSLAAKFINWARSFIEKIATNSKIVQRISNIIEKFSTNTSNISELVTKFFNSFSDKISEELSKIAESKLGKAVSKLVSGATLAVAKLAITFAEGMDQAESIFRVSNPTVLETFLAGLAKLATEYLTWGLLPTSYLVTALTGLCSGILHIDMDDLEQRQQETEEMLTQYNLENGTDYTVEEWLYFDKSFCGKLENWWNNSRVAAIPKGIVDAAIDTGGGLLSGALNVGGGLLKGAGSLLGTGVAGTISSIAKGDWAGAGKNLVSGVAGAITNPIVGVGKGIASVGSGLWKAGGSFVNGFARAFGLDKDEEETQTASEETTAEAIASDKFNINNYIDNTDESEESETPTILESQPSVFGDSTGTTTLTDPVTGNTWYTSTQSQNDITDVDTGVTEGTGTITGAGAISDDNKEAVTTAVALINKAIPTAIEKLETSVAGFFGLSSDDLTTGTTSYTAEAEKSKSWMDSVTDMWESVTDKSSSFISSMPDAITKSMKSLSRFLAVNFGFADATDEDADLLSIIDDPDYVNDRAAVIQANSIFANTLSGYASYNGADSSKYNTIAKGLSSNSIVSKTISTLGKKSTISKIATGVATALSKIGSVFSGSGSGVDSKDSAKTDVINTDPAADNFVSQKYGKYANMRFGTADSSGKYHTISETGCAPAAATMAVNNTLASEDRLDMSDAVKLADKYHSNDGGVTADYFADEFKRHGLGTSYLLKNNTNSKAIVKNRLRSGKSVILMGQDANNTTKTKSPFGPKSHYVVATGLSKNGNTIYINDPESKYPKVAYSTDKILNSSELSIIPVASKRVSRTLNKVAKDAVKAYSGMATSGIIYVGDSRTVGMQSAVGESNKYIFIGQVSQGYSWLKSSAMQKAITKAKANPTYAVVFNFGVNDLGNISSYISYYKNKAKSFPNSDNVWYMSVNPVVDGKSNATTADVVAFNKKLKEFAGNRYIDTYNYLMSNGYTSPDGLHYDSSTYLKIHNYVNSVINGTSSTNSTTNTTASGITQEQWLDVVRYWIYTMENDGDWIYSNSGNITKPVKARSSSPRKTNCALMVVHALHKAKIFSGSNKFYGHTDGHIAYSGKSSSGTATKDLLSKVATIYHYSKGEMSYSKAKTFLRPGDIVCYYGQHTNIYMGRNSSGDMTWYDAGRWTTVGKTNGSRWDSFARVANSGMEISNIIRLNYSGTAINIASDITKTGWKTPQCSMPVISGSSETESSSSSNSGTTTTTTGHSLDQIISAFDGIAAAYGLTSTSSSTSEDDSSSSSGSSSSGSSSSNNVSDDTTGISGKASSNSLIAKRQLAVVAKMKSIEGTLKYAQNNAKYPGSRNPDDGSGDCSSTVQWAYNKTEGVDVGDWTGAQLTSNKTYTVESPKGSKWDESKLQLGDLLLFGNSADNTTHVEMYYGNSQSIGHGNPQKKGPTIKNLDYRSDTWVAKRLNGFKSTGSSEISGSGSGLFVSQRDPRYANMNVGDNSVADAGCAPAVATMMMADAKGTSMNDAINDANGYVASDGGVRADYFEDQFAKNGYGTAYTNNENAITNALSGGNSMVLMGADKNNNSKSRSPFGPNNHYVMATGMSKDGKYTYINDPEATKGNTKYKTSNLKGHIEAGIMPTGRGSDVKHLKAAANSTKAKAAAASSKLQVLFIGNSKTSMSSIPAKFRNLATSGGHDVQVTFAKVSALSKTSSEAKELCTKRVYDVVIMQDQSNSVKSGGINSYIRGVNNAMNTVKEKSPNATFYLRETWPLTTWGTAARSVCTKYAEQVADKFAIKLIYDGTAFYNCEKKYPIIKLMKDTRHQNDNGAYLVICCIYKALFDSPLGLSYIGGINKGVAKKLQTIADETIATTSINKSTTTYDESTALGTSSSDSDSDSSGDTSNIDDSSTTTTTSSNKLEAILSTFDDLAAAYGLKSKEETTEDSSSSDSDSSSSSSDNVYNGTVSEDDSDAVKKPKSTTYIWNYLKSKNVPEKGIAAIMGNTEHEGSNEFYTVQGDYTHDDSDAYNREYTNKVNSGTISKSDFVNGGPGGGGYGLAQWTYHTRKEGLYNKTVAQGKSISSPKGQMDWLWEELQGYTGVKNAIMNPTSIADATKKFLYDFENPSDKEGTYPGRYSSAKTIYKEFTGKTATGSGLMYNQSTLGKTRGHGLLPIDIRNNKEIPKPANKQFTGYDISKLAGKGTTSNTTTLKTPTYNYGSSSTNTSSTNTTSSVSTLMSALSSSSSSSSKTSSSDEKINKLIEMIIQLLGQVVTNTSSISQIAQLLVTLVESSGSTNSSGSDSSEVIRKGLADTSTLVAKSIVQNAKRNDSKSLEQLIANVEAIVAQ